MSLDRGDTLFSHDAGQLLAPASNLKLFTSAAALHYLGPDFRYQTYLLTDGVIRDSVLDGNLILYGTGDPTISDRLYPTKTDVWRMLADTLQARGIREVRGDVVGDASYFQGAPYGVGWKMEYVNTWYAAPSSALTFGEAMVTLLIRPALQADWRPRIRILPQADGIALVNDARTVRRGRTYINATRAAYDGPIVVTGQLSLHHNDVWRAVPVADPARYAAASFRQVLIDAGVRVDGGIRSVHDAAASPVTARRVFAPAFTHRPRLQVLAVHHSPPMIDLLTVLNKRSHNLYAEQILRTIGRVVSGVGTMEAGRDAVYAMLDGTAKPPPDGLRMLDGSGLSVLDRVDTRTVVKLLEYVRRQPFFDDFVSTLPVAGGIGLHRMRHTPAEHNLVAKTGTLDSVSALSGYVTAADGEQLAFSIISNDVPSTWRAKRVEDAIGEHLARFSRPVSALATGSATPAIPAARARRTPPREAQLAIQAQAILNRRDRVSGAGGTYVIRRGDTFEGIARHYGISVSALKHANPHVRPRRLIPGRRVAIPGHGGS